MGAQENLQAGRLQEALSELEQQVRAQPTQVKHRLFLFQLLALLGHWPKVLTQLEVVAELQEAARPMVATYREAVMGEVQRAKFFSGGEAPTIMGQGAAWVEQLIEAVGLEASGQEAAAWQLRREALEKAPTTAGYIDGQGFCWVADGDHRFGPVLEVIAQGRYMWLPLSELAALRCSPPKDLRDLVWVPAHLMLRGGEQCAVLLPVRYPGSESGTDGAVALARATLWRRHEHELFSGVGQRMWITDAGQHALLDVRELKMGQQASPIGTAPCQA